MKMILFDIVIAVNYYLRMKFELKNKYQIPLVIMLALIGGTFYIVFNFLWDSYTEFLYQRDFDLINTEIILELQQKISCKSLVKMGSDENLNLSFDGHSNNVSARIRSDQSFHWDRKRFEVAPLKLVYKGKNILYFQYDILGMDNAKFTKIDKSWHKTVFPKGSFDRVKALSKNKSIDIKVFSHSRNIAVKYNLLNNKKGYRCEVF